MTSSTSISALVEPEQGGDLAAIVVHALTLRVDVQAAVARHGQTGLRLEERVLDALRREGLFEHVHRPGERRFDITSAIGAGIEQIAAVVNPGRFRGERRGRLGHRLEHFVVDRDQLGGVAGVAAAVGHDDREHVADAPGRLTHRHQNRPVVFDEAEKAGPGHVGSGDDAFDPGCSAAGAMSIERTNARGWADSTTAACSMNGIFRSATNGLAPSTWSRTPRRGTAPPTPIAVRIRG